MTDVIAAERHSPAYLLHKYWARKPANVIANLLDAYVPDGGSVLDPFCGSGVTLIEANRLGRSATGIDINPAACLISRVSVSPPCPKRFRSIASDILDEWRPAVEEAYSVDGLESAGYCVHTTVVCCSACEHEVRVNACTRQGNRYLCPHCGSSLTTGLKGAVGTAVIAVGGQRNELADDAELCAAHDRAASAVYAPKKLIARFDARFLPNRRVLSFEGMTLASLFTSRNFSLLARVAEMIHDTKEPELRDALLLWLTSAVASCSRLIPYRDNMNGGGPAWTVPGFWVPPIHLERSPASHLSARVNKLARGFEVLRNTRTTARAEIIEGDALRSMKILGEKGSKFDLVFLDPPYGDSVPYLEFSQVWNPWIEPGRPIRFDAEVVVSDRTELASHWDEYSSRLEECFAAVRGLLKRSGRACVTFNSLDVRSWRALLNGIHAAELWCDKAVYQVPAVISAKASFSPSGSYVGDLYVVLRHRRKRDVGHDWEWVQERLRLASELRDGAISKVTQTRTAALSVLEGNVEPSALELLPNTLADLPDRTPSVPRSSELFGRLEQALGTALSEGAIPPKQLVQLAVEAAPAWCPLDLHEIFEMLKSIGATKTNGCWSIASEQLELFSQ